jgi:lipopolysaccharide transport system permease protein
VSESVPINTPVADASDETRFDRRGGKTPVIVNQADKPLAGLDLREIWAYRDLLYFLTWRDIKVRYKQAAMGAAWAIIQPLGMMFIFTIFFGVFMKVPTEGMSFALFFYCGLVPWTFFSSAISAGSVSLLSSSNLVTKVYFPRLIVPMAAVGALLIDLSIACAILAGLALYFGINWSWHLLGVPAMIALTIFLAVNLSIWLAALTVKYRDIRHALPFVLQLWMFLTPIIYSLSVVPAKWRWVMYLNPLTGIVEGMRASLMGRHFNRTAILFSFVIAFLTLPISIKVFQRIEKTFADLI